MPYKVNHYAAKTVTLKPTLDIESIGIELSIGAISAVMAIGGYNADVLLMALPCAVVSVASWLLAAMSIWRYVFDCRMAKQGQSASKTGTAESE